MPEEILASVQVRRDNKANWEAVNPILLDGEAAYEKDTDMFKIGDGVNKYKDLPYHNKVGPKGDTGSSGVYIGTSQPTDSNINVWIDSDGEPTEVIDDFAREEIGSIKDDKVDKDEILNAGIKSFSYVPMFGGEFTVTTVDEEGYISPHSRASVTGRISKHYTYRITFNGEMYELPCGLHYFKDMGEGKTVEYLGNLSLYTEDTSFSTHDIQNVPFCIISDLDDKSSIDVFTQFPKMNSILVEQIQKEQIVFPKSLVWGDDYCPIEFKRNDGTYNGMSIGLNLLKSTRGTFAVGYGNKVCGDFSQALGSNCEASGISAMAIGASTTASGDGSYAEGYKTIANGNYSHTEGYGTTATANGMASHAEGHNTTATGNGSHAEGDQTTTNGMASHAEGHNTTTNGNTSHAEGNMTTATGNASHAEGQKCIANGHLSHSGGNISEANGRASFAHGNFVKATHPSQFVVGYGNNPQEDSIFEIGNGLDANGQPANTGNTEPATRQNAFRVTQSGIAVVKTGLQIGNTIINEEQLQKIIALIN